MNSARGFTFGILAGAALMFVFDPRGGTARRAALRQRSVRAEHEVETAIGIGARDLSHRAHGIAAMVVGPRRPAAVHGDKLVARVRAKLGRVCSHARAVDVSSKGDGVIELKGPILRADVKGTLSAIHRVRGVSRIEDELEVHETADIPALRGPIPPRGGSNVLFTPAARFLGGAVSAVVALSSLLRGRPFGFIAGSASMLALAHSIAQRSPRKVAARPQEEERVAGLREAYPAGSEWAPAGG